MVSSSLVAVSGGRMVFDVPLGNATLICALNESFLVTVPRTLRLRESKTGVNLAPWSFGLTASICARRVSLRFVALNSRR